MNAYLRGVLVIVRNVLLSIASIVVCFVLFEGAFRLVSSIGNKRVNWEDRPLFYYMPKSTQSLRGLHYEQKKLPSNFRVAVVGDSFSFAPYMQYDDAFPARLERMLNLNDSEHKAEVINYGVPGFSTTHEAVDVEKAVNEEDADLVILQITLNDPERKPLRPTGMQVLKNPYAALEITEATHPILSRWKSLAYIISKVHDKAMQNVYRDYYTDLWQDKRSVDEFEEALKKIQRICAAKNIPLVAVIFPLFGYPLDDTYPFHYIHARIHELLEKGSISSLDLFQAFHGAPLERMVVLPGKDFHPNEIAHRMAAEEIYVFLAMTTFNTKPILPDEFKISSLYKKRTQIKLLPALKEDINSIRSRTNTHSK